ncbi:hypothetical protein EU520_01585 [Candidatus Thorarchaeota archaeon]|nr:MAG: hypothetical protein EU520_01585 [Candidatus Thorarchaeota archaeon]
MHYHEEARTGFNPQEVVETVRDAHEYFKENNVDERYEAVALDLIRRYVSTEERPRELEPLYAASLYLVTRHPWSHPNPLTRTEFATKLRLKESSLEWYADSLIEKLGFSVFHDQSQLPFYIDPQGTIASVINSVVRTSVNEEVVLGIVRGGAVAPSALAERIVERLCKVVKILPNAFERDLFTLVEKKIEEESEKLLTELNQTLAMGL